MRPYPPVKSVDLYKKTPLVFHPYLECVNIEQWNSMGQKLWKKYENDAEPEWRIHGYYLPVLFYLMRQLDQRSIVDLPFIVGINGPQGAGKSTLSQEMTSLLLDCGIRAVSMSIDDFYLSREQQVQLAQQYPDNPLLQQRGYPGTHDIELGRRTLQSLKGNAAGSEILIPVYDKSKHQGQGDRLPESEWKKLTSPVQLVFLDGWMLGYTELGEDALPNVHFKQVNELLKDYRQWYAFLDRFIFLNPKNYRDVLDWRVEAEEKMKAAGKSGMSRTEIETYIKKFLPAYEMYLPAMRRMSETENWKGKWFQLNLLKSRLPEF